MTGKEVPGDAEVMYRATKQKSAPKVDEMEVLPFHIAPGSVEAKRWMQELPYVVFKSKRKGDTRSRLRPNGAHSAASNGNLDLFKVVLSKHPEWLNASDQNGWQPIHEAARGGHREIVAYLIEKGANLNTRTNKGTGGTALWWAEKTHGKSHPVPKMLTAAGALKLGPGE